MIKNIRILQQKYKCFRRVYDFFIILKVTKAVNYLTILEHPEE